MNRKCNEKKKKIKCHSHHRDCKKVVKPNTVFCKNVQINGLLSGGNLHHSVPLTEKDVKCRAKKHCKEDTYDAIVVGAGTAGSLFAYNWAKKYPNKRLLVLETGRNDEYVEESNDENDPWGQLNRSLFSILGEGCAQWQQEIVTEDNQQLFRTPIQMARGATWGGTSSVNAAVWNRATPNTYKSWAQLSGDEAFNLEGMTEAYKKIENRSSQTRYYSTPIPYWTPGNPVPNFDLAENMGIDGQMRLNQSFLPVSQTTPTQGNPYGIYTGYQVRAIQEALQEAPLPGRDETIPLFVDPENPTNPPEVAFCTPGTNFDQSDPDYGLYNPYIVPIGEPEFPGYTYDSGYPPSQENPLGPEFTGPTPYSVYGQILPKSITNRCSAAPAFLYPISFNRIPNNVTIVSNAYVTELLFDDANPLECIGVEYAVDGWQVAEINRAISRDALQYRYTLSEVSREQCSVKAAVENQKTVTKKKVYAALDIWLCAGALDSPAILQRAGIAARSLIESIRVDPIKLRLDLPGVGQSLQDTMDFFVTYNTERNLSVSLGDEIIPCASELAYDVVFGSANPVDPLQPIISSTIGGAVLDISHSVRVRSSPAKEESDAIILCQTFAGGTGVGSYLWQDIADIFSSWEIKADFEKLNPVYDRYKAGMVNIGANNDYINYANFLIEYFDMLSKGQVNIQSGNPYERPTYAPNMGANELDLQALSNILENTVIPLCSRLASKRFGPRGPGTYQGQALAFTVNTVNMLPFLIALKPFADKIDQSVYDTPGSLGGYTLSFADGINRVIVGWSGAPSYVANIFPDFDFVPAAPLGYFLNPPGATPLDSVEFTDDNYRNFSKFVSPSADVIFNAWFEEPLFDALTTEPYIPNPFGPLPLPPINAGTKVTVHLPFHDLKTGDFIRMVGVNVPVDAIEPEALNDYHVVYKIDDDNFYIILAWNITPLAGPSYSIVPSPGTGNVGLSNTGGELGIQYLNYDGASFRQWVKTHYFSGWHSCCTTRMGREEDELAVVDKRCRVFGIKGLRVLDAGSFPSKPNGNTMAPVYGLAQKVFDLVAEEEYDNFLKLLPTCPIQKKKKVELHYKKAIDAEQKQKKLVVPAKNVEKRKLVRPK